MNTRQHILDILSTHGEATIEQIGASLRQRSGRTVSSVTIRYHLNVLLEEGLVTEPRSVPRATRGRPQHVFAASPSEPREGNSAEVLSHIFAALRQDPAMAASVLDRAAITMGEAAAIPAELSLRERMYAASAFLNSRGYDASIEQVERGFILYTRHCPYHDLPERQSVMCGLDMRLIEIVLGQSVQRLMRLADGEDSCAYFVTNIEENC
jgi:predicted ArsR family transcriptional regulator